MIGYDSVFIYIYIYTCIFLFCLSWCISPPCQFNLGMFQWSWLFSFSVASRYGRRAPSHLPCWIGGSHPGETTAGWSFEGGSSDSRQYFCSREDSGNLSGYAWKFSFGVLDFRFGWLGISAAIDTVATEQISCQVEQAARATDRKSMGYGELEEAVQMHLPGLKVKTSQAKPSQLPFHMWLDILEPKF